jgi:hypothetical protein
MNNFNLDEKFMVPFEEVWNWGANLISILLSCEHQWQRLTHNLIVSVLRQIHLLNQRFFIGAKFGQNRKNKSKKGICFLFCFFCERFSQISRNKLKKLLHLHSF